MKKRAGAIVGATVGGVAAVAAHFVTGPIGLMVLASTLVTIDTSARLGAMVAEACDEGSRDFSVAINVG